MSEPKVSIVIPVIGYKNLPPYLINCIKTLIYPKKNLDVVLVSEINQRFSLRLSNIVVSSIKHKGPIGYAQAANLGIKKAKGELIFLINPDILLHKNILQIMIRYFIHNPNIGILGPLVFQFKSPKKISSYDLPGINFNKQFGKVTFATKNLFSSLKNSYEVDWLSGCALFFSRNVWLKLGGFEEKLFIYWEDADFCMRAKEKGLKVILIPNARVWHEGSVYMRSQSFSKIYYLKRNGMYFLEKHSGLLGKVMVHAHNFLMFLIKLMRFILQPHKRRESYVFLLGIIDFYRGKWGKFYER